MSGQAWAVVFRAADRRHCGGTGRHLGSGRREVTSGHHVASGRRMSRRFCEPGEVGGSPADPAAQCADLQQNCRDPLVAAGSAVTVRAVKAFRTA